MHTKRLTITYVALAAALLGLFALNLFWGSVALSPADIAAALLGRRTNALAANILLQLRLPRAVMVVLLGAALSVAGYLLQTFFANPIAGPFVMGISSGAKLAVALVIFTTWKPLNAIWGAYLFGMLYWLYQFLPSLLGITMASHITDLVQMLPYVVTIIVLIVVSMRKKKENQPPEHLGLSYFREER